MIADWGEAGEVGELPHMDQGEAGDEVLAEVWIWARTSAEYVGLLGAPWA